MWEFNNVMKISMGEATWKLIYTDRGTYGQTDGRTDVVKSLSEGRHRMATATRVAGNEKGKGAGNKEGNGN